MNLLVRDCDTGEDALDSYDDVRLDWVKLNIPAYPKIIKKPMDLSTMRRKLDNKEYADADKFFDDFSLMIRNCMNFNPAGTPVNTAGLELQRLFEEKWMEMPPLKGVASDAEDEEEEDENSDEDRERKSNDLRCESHYLTSLPGAIAALESQINKMRGNLEALKGLNKPEKKVKKEKKEKKKKEKVYSPPVASTSKMNGKAAKQAPVKKKTAKKVVPDDDVLSFEQKKDLSETIQTLDGEKLEKVINIIHEGVPEIRDVRPSSHLTRSSIHCVIQSTEEIELDIDQLPAAVLTKLYNFVLRPLKPAAAKRNRTGTGTGTGGLKRKSMDEDVEAEKIRQLEERMRMFDNKGAVGMGAKRDVDSEHSSDDSSSDSSGSDSE